MEEAGWLDGKKTFIGLILILIGMIAKNYFGDEAFEKAVADFFEIAGIVMAAYGRYNAKVPLSPDALTSSQTTNRFQQ